jgi:hypothetical protein
MNTIVTTKTWKSTTQGVLIIPAIMIILSIIAHIVYYIFLPLAFRNNSFYSYEINDYPVIHIGNFLFLILTLYLGYFYFKRKKIAPSLFITIRLIYFIYVALLIAVFYNMDIFKSLQNDLIASVTSCMLLVSIFIYSKKTDAVFTEEITEQNWIERTTKIFEPKMNRFHAVLTKRKKWLIPLILIVCTIITMTIFLLYNGIYFLFMKPAISL